jgi:putrescine transport system substrate-binding protein
VFDPASGMAGHVTLLREVTDLIGCALIYLGRSPNSVEERDLADVVKLVRSLRGKVRRFTTDTYIDELAADETWLAQGWSGDVFQAQDQNQDVSYAIPKEGSLRFVDVMAIPKGAPHPANAARFMNYVLHPKVQARISKYVSYGTLVSLAKTAAAVRADQRPLDLPAGVDQAVDRHPDRPEAGAVAGRLRPDRALALPP